MSDDVAITLPRGDVCSYCGKVEGLNGVAVARLVFTQHTVDGQEGVVTTWAHDACAQAECAGDAWIVRLARCEGRRVNVRERT